MPPKNPNGRASNKMVAIMLGLEDYRRKTVFLFNPVRTPGIPTDLRLDLYIEKP